MREDSEPFEVRSDLGRTCTHPASSFPAYIPVSLFKQSLVAPSTRWPYCWWLTCGYVGSALNHNGEELYLQQ